MDRDARRPSPIEVTKGIWVEGVLVGLTKPRRAMASDLLHGSVPLPAGWLTRRQRSFVALDGSVQLDAAMQATGSELAVLVIRLCAIQIPQLIEAYLAHRRTSPQAPDRQERESLRRGTGPAAVRAVIFASGRTWPTGNLDRLEPDVTTALDAALDARRRRMNPPTVDAHVLGPLAEQAAVVVLAYSRRVGASTSDAAWLLSEVSDQLARNVATGRLPRDVDGWTRATAARKWRSRGAVDPGRWPAGRWSGRVTFAREVPHVDEELTRVDMVETLRATGDWHAARAEKLRRLDDVENAAVHDVAAAALRMADVIELAALLRHEEKGAEDLVERVARLGIDLTAGRRVAVVRIIRDSLREALDLPAPQSGTEVS